MKIFLLLQGVAIALIYKFSASIVQPIQFLLLPFMKKLKMNHHPRRGLSDIDIERIGMGEELCDADINLAQRLPIIGYSSPNWVAYNLLCYSKKAPIPERRNVSNFTFL